MRKLKALLFVVIGLILGAIAGALVGGGVGWVLTTPVDKHGALILVASWAGMAFGAVALGAIGLWLALRSGPKNE